MEEKETLNIILAGMPGAGKSYIGEKLSKLLAHFNYVDTDEEIEKRTDLTIYEIFEKFGEKYFRDLETDVIKEISKNRKQIISLGGGSFERTENIHTLKKSGLIFYLKAKPEELFNRIKNETHRPLLNEDSPEKIMRNLLKKRENSYLKADFVIDTNQKQAYTILNDILKEYENYVK